MSSTRRSYRSFVSYIDKSRQYYAAQGYDQPYQWATHSHSPFTPLAKPLSESKVGVITTAYFLPDDFVYRVPSDLPRQPYAEFRQRSTNLNTEHLFWAKDETHTKDAGSFLPLAQLDRAAQEGRIGSVSDRFYGLPTQYSHRRTQKVDVPKVLDWMRQDEVDVALMVPL